jgi:hypothetical protein
MNTNDLIGAFGVSILLLAFFLNLFGYLKNNSAGYSLLNAIGAAIAGYASYLIHYVPFVVLEMTWMIVSVTGLIRAVRK